MPRHKSERKREHASSKSPHRGPPRPAPARSRARLAATPRRAGKSGDGEPAFELPVGSVDELFELPVGSVDELFPLTESSTDHPPPAMEPPSPQPHRKIERHVLESAAIVLAIFVVGVLVGLLLTRRAGPSGDSSTVTTTQPLPAPAVERPAAPLRERETRTTPSPTEKPRLEAYAPPGKPPRARQDRRMPGKTGEWLLTARRRARGQRGRLRGRASMLRRP
jgi:hypothetical protein